MCLSVMPTVENFISRYSIMYKKWQRGRYIGFIYLILISVIIARLIWHSIFDTIFSFVIHIFKSQI